MTLKMLESNLRVYLLDHLSLAQQYLEKHEAKVSKSHLYKEELSRVTLLSPIPILLRF